MIGLEIGHGQAEGVPTFEGDRLDELAGDRDGEPLKERRQLKGEKCAQLRATIPRIIHAQRKSPINKA